MCMATTLPAALNRIASILLVLSCARPERFLLWPMGVRSPGAMRQWGRHAVAFVGRRHFDDAHLLDSLFEPAEAP